MPYRPADIVENDNGNNAGSLPVYQVSSSFTITSTPSTSSSSLSCFPSFLELSISPKWQDHSIYKAVRSTGCFVYADPIGHWLNLNEPSCEGTFICFRERPFLTTTIC